MDPSIDHCNDLGIDIAIIARFEITPLDQWH